MTMTIFRTLIWNFLLPAVISAAIISIARRLSRNAPSGRSIRWGIALGLGLGYLAGHVGLLGWPGVPDPSLDAMTWVVWFVLVAVVLGGIEASWTMPNWATWGLRGVFVATILATLLRAKFEGGWGAGEATSWACGLWIVLLASWWNLEAQADRLSGPGWVVPIGLVTCGWATVQLLCRGAALAQLDGVFASTILGALLTVGLRPGQALSKGGSAIVLTVISGLGLTGFFYSEVPASAASVLIVAPWTLWIDRIGFIRRRSYWTRASIRFLAVLLVLGAAVFLVDMKVSVQTDTELAF